MANQIKGIAIDPIDPLYVLCMSVYVINGRLRYRQTLLSASCHGDDEWKRFSGLLHAAGKISLFLLVGLTAFWGGILMVISSIPLHVCDI